MCAPDTIRADSSMVDVKFGVVVSGVRDGQAYEKDVCAPDCEHGKVYVHLGECSEGVEGRC